MMRALSLVSAIALGIALVPAAWSQDHLPDQPFVSDLTTTWGEDVTAENAWTEYPRPQLRRSHWQNLNGHWDYAVTAADQQVRPSTWAGKILVPFPLESKLSGVQRLLGADQALWYRRTFAIDTTDQLATLLNFEAVDYACEVLVNGKSVGRHRGGNLPFVINISDAVRTGDNELVVRVEDDTLDWQLRGKQVIDPKGIFYTQNSGIWQTVWIEQVGTTHIADLTIQTNADQGEITVRADITGPEAAKSIRMVVFDGDQIVSDLRSEPAAACVARIADATRWSPNRPHLYDLEISVLDSQQRVLDQVSSYAGIRSVGKQRDADGHLRFTLNGQIVFHLGPLDQGWWPDGLLTPPSDEAIQFEIEWLKKAGFNSIRKHIKVEPRRYYYHCDRIGMMVWQDQVSGGRNAKWTRLKPDPVDAVWPAEHHRQFMRELDEMIDSLENHPSIVMWVPFNEAWGQHRTLEVGQWTINRDPTRLVNIASGGNFWPIGDVVDHHSYPHPKFDFDPERYRDFVKVVGEFGGHGYPVQNHLWDSQRRNWGYGDLPKSKQEFVERYLASMQQLNELRKVGIAGGIYTQTTDVEGEINGLMTYDRKVIKISATELARQHQLLLETDE